MKITFLLPGLGVSGGVRVTAVMAQMLFERGHDVTLYYYRPTENLKAVLKRVRDKILYHRASMWLEGYRGVIRSFKSIEKCIFQKKEIVVGVGMWASKMLGHINHDEKRKIQYIHGATPWDDNLMREALGLPYPKIAVAEYLHSVINSIGSGEVLAVIPNGIDINEYYCSVSPERKSGVGTIFSSHPAKDPDTVIEVLRKIRLQDYNVPIRVFGTEKKPSGIAHIEYTRYPSLSVARDIYSKTKVWFMASRSEGFPAPPLEAMACGCAVVATDCGGTSEIIKNDENGYLVEVGNAEEIANRALELLDDDETRLRFKTVADTTVKRYNWDKSIDLLENALKRFK